MKSLLLLILLITAATAAPSYSMSLTVEGDNAVVIGNSDRTWESGSDLTKISNQVFTGGAAGHQVLTSPGAVRYQQQNTLDASVSNLYTSTGYVETKGGLVTSDSISMDDVTPNSTDLSCTAGNLGVDGSGTIPGNVANHQRVSGQRTAIGQSMTIDTSKYVNDAEVILSSRANWTGAGMYLGSFDGQAETGATKNSTVPSYEADVHDTFGIHTGMNNTGVTVRPQNAWGDFSEAFVAETSNQTISQRTNEPVNETGEED